MLSRKTKLQTKEIDQVKASRQEVFSPSFTLKYVDRGDTGVAKFACVISKKIDKRAVVRNKLKRLIKKAVKQTHVGEGRNYVFFVKRAISDKTEAAIIGEVKHAFETLQK